MLRRDFLKSVCYDLSYKLSKIVIFPKEGWTWVKILRCLQLDNGIDVETLNEFVLNN
jgi:hypothetical protein